MQDLNVLFLVKAISIVLLLSIVLGVSFFWLGLFSKKKENKKQAPVKKRNTEVKKKCNVQLISVGSDKIETIKTIKEFIDLDLTTVKEKVESSLPAILIDDMPIDLARKMKTKLQKLNTDIEITETHS